jgi:hypothetical protein
VKWLPYSYSWVSTLGSDEPLRERSGWKTAFEEQPNLTWKLKVFENHWGKRQNTRGFWITNHNSSEELWRNAENFLNLIKLTENDCWLQAYMNFIIGAKNEDSQTSYRVTVKAPLTLRQLVSKILHWIAIVLEKFACCLEASV